MPQDWSGTVQQILTEVPEVLDPVAAYADLPYPISDAHPSQFVLGSFGAAGLPSLYHHPILRQIRIEVYRAMYPIFAEMYPGKKIEVLFDRFSIRRKGSQLSGESWHRDVAPPKEAAAGKRKRPETEGGKMPGDKIFGGWLNLDPPGAPDQYFSCLPGNVMTSEQDSNGFVPFSKAETARLEAEFKAAKSRIAIPPRHLIVFDQTIAHKVTGKVLPSTSYRLYFGWRITDHSEPLYNNDEIIRRQGVPLLPSGEISPMYAQLNLVNWRERLEHFSSLFRPELMDPLKPGILKRVCPSLEATGLAFAPYTSEERKIFYPRLLRPGVLRQASPRPPVLRQASPRPGVLRQASPRPPVLRPAALSQLPPLLRLSPPPRGSLRQLPALLRLSSPTHPSRSPFWRYRTQRDDSQEEND